MYVMRRVLFFLEVSLGAKFLQPSVSIFPGMAETSVAICKKVCRFPAGKLFAFRAEIHAVRLCTIRYETVVDTAGTGPLTAAGTGPAAHMFQGIMKFIKL